jgi:hypothetical protein
VGVALAERLAYALGAVGVALAAWAASRPAGARVAPYLLGHALLAAASGLACLGVARAEDPAAALRRVVVAGFVARAALVPVAPFTTTDVGRYLWDGAVALRGLDPYALTPLAPQLAGLRGTFPAPTDHLDVATCYPPLALALFALAAACGARALLAWKALCAAASIATGGLVARECVDEGRGAWAPLALLGPVAVLETCVGAHLDAFVALAVVAMVVAARRGRWTLAALCAGAVVALKYVPGVVALPLLARAPRKLWFAAVAAAPLALSLAAAEALGMTPPGSLPSVAEHWSFGSPVWTALYARFPVDDDVTRPVLAAAGFASIALIALLRKDFARATADALGLSLAVSPVIYPWYGTSLASLVALAPRAWTLFALCVLPTSYEVLDAFHAHGRWAPARWPMHLLAAAVCAGLLVDVGRRLRAR